MPSSAPSFTSPPRSTLAVAVIAGAIGVASLPLTLAVPGYLSVYLSLGGPVAVGLTGEATGVRWLRTTGMVVSVVGAVTPVLGLGLLLTAGTALSPLAVVLVVGPALRRVDATAGAAFLAACAVTIAGGFVAAGLTPSLVVTLTTLVLTTGAAAALLRLGTVQGRARAALRASATAAQQSTRALR